jgi:hypothetical protein
MLPTGTVSKAIPLLEKNSSGTEVVPQLAASVLQEVEERDEVTGGSGYGSGVRGRLCGCARR